MLKKIKEHTDYPSILSYYDSFIDLDIKCNVIKVAEYNIDALEFPLLAILCDNQEDSILTYITKIGNSYQYIKNNSFLIIEKQELEIIWLGIVIHVRDADEILIEKNEVENKVTNKSNNLENSNNLKLLGMRNNIDNKSDLFHWNIDVIGNDNKIFIDEGTCLTSCFVKVRGNNNFLFIAKDCRIGGYFTIEGDGGIIKIDKETTIEQATFSATESKSIEIGSDCMFSNNITIQTSDSHSIIDNKTNLRINHSGNVIIQNHVWIAPSVNILKGVTIGTGSVIGIGSVVTKNVPQNCVFAGNPAKIVKSDISWKRELLKEINH